MREALVNATSFKLEGVDFRLRDNRKDKRTKLWANDQCPVGLLDRVCQVVEAAGHVPVVTRADSTMAPKPDCLMHVHGAVPRDYQQEAEMAAWFYDRGIVRAPTGSGKTLMGAMMIAAKGRHAVVIVPTIDLLHQYKQSLEKHLALDTGVVAPRNSAWRIGQLGDGVVDPQPVTVATIRTMAKVLGVAYETYTFAEYDDSDDTTVNPAALRAWVDQLGTVLVDEAHILGAKSVYAVATKIPAYYKYGFSASPWRDDGADLMIEAATGPVIYHISPKRLVEGGYLMAPHIQIYDTSSWWSSAAWGRTCTNCGAVTLKWTEQCKCGGTSFRSQYTQAYREEIVQNDLRNGRIAQIVQQLDRPTLVLVKQVAHGRDLANILPQALFLSGKDSGDWRQRIFDAVRSGEVKTLVCTAIADMGLDIPNLGALVLAGGGKSSVRHLQRIGRVVRPAPGKPTPIVVDMDDGHIHGWFSSHEQARRKIEQSEWQGLATWERIE